MSVDRSFCRPLELIQNIPLVLLIFILTTVSSPCAAGAASGLVEELPLILKAIRNPFSLIALCVILFYNLFAYLIVGRVSNTARTIILYAMTAGLVIVTTSYFLSKDDMHLIIFLACLSAPVVFSFRVMTFAGDNLERLPPLLRYATTAYLIILLVGFIGFWIVLIYWFFHPL
jgi:hypothetical protein